MKKHLFKSITIIQYERQESVTVEPRLHLPPHPSSVRQLEAPDTAAKNTVSPGLGPFSPVSCRRAFFPGGAGCQHFSTAFSYLFQGLSPGPVQHPLMYWMTCSTLGVAGWGCWVPIVPAPSLGVGSMLGYKLGGPHATAPQAPPTTKLLECGALREKLATVLNTPQEPWPKRCLGGETGLKRDISWSHPKGTAFKGN